MPGLLVKLLGGIGFGLVHTFYFTYGGDTKTYFHDMSIITDYFYQDPYATLSYLFGKYSYLNNEKFSVQDIIRCANYFVHR